MAAKASKKTKKSTANSKIATKAKSSAPPRKPAKAKTVVKAKAKQVKTVKPGVKAKAVAKKVNKPAPAMIPAVKKPAAAKPVPTKAAPLKAVAPSSSRSDVKHAKEDKPMKPSGVVVRTGPSIAPRNLGKSPLSALRGAPVKKHTEKSKPLTEKELVQHRDLLLKLRDRVIDEISFLANDNLNKSAKDASGDLSSYSFHMADQGTDNFDREFAASLLNSEHDVLYEIEEALRRIEQGTYGICEQSGEPIERERLRALPFVRFCMAVQTEMERGKPKFRPFRRVSIQAAETTT